MILASMIQPQTNQEWGRGVIRVGVMGNIAPIAFVIDHQGWLKLFKTECANYFETQNVVA